MKPNVVSLGKERDVKEWGIRCPHCAHFTHSFFDDNDTRASRKRLQDSLERFKSAPKESAAKRWEQYQFQKKVFARIYWAAQTKLRRKYGLSPVAEKEFV